MFDKSNWWAFWIYRSCMKEITSNSTESRNKKSRDTHDNWDWSWSRVVLSSTKHIINKYKMIPVPPLPEASILMKALIVLFHLCVLIKPCEPWLKSMHRNKLTQNLHISLRLQYSVDSLKKYSIRKFVLGTSEFFYSDRFPGWKTLQLFSPRKWKVLKFLKGNSHLIRSNGIQPFEHN